MPKDLEQWITVVFDTPKWAKAFFELNPLEIKPKNLKWVDGSDTVKIFSPKADIKKLRKELFENYATILKSITVTIN